MYLYIFWVHRDLKVKDRSKENSHNRLVTEQNMCYSPFNINFYIHDSKKFNKLLLNVVNLAILVVHYQYLKIVFNGCCYYVLVISLCRCAHAKRVYDKEMCIDDFQVRLYSYLI